MRFTVLYIFVVFQSVAFCRLFLVVFVFYLTIVNRPTFLRSSSSFFQIGMVILLRIIFSTKIYQKRTDSAVVSVKIISYTSQRYIPCTHSTHKRYNHQYSGLKITKSVGQIEYQQSFI